MQISIVLFILTALIAMYSGCTTTYVRQGQKVFRYDVSAGKPPNPKDNPLLSMGFHGAFGIDPRFFTVSGLLMDYDFTNVGGSSPDDEQLNWNSKEGVTMATDFKVYGHVSDPWEFFVHFGEADYVYHSKFADARVYEALRQSGKYIDVKLNDLAGRMDAETIRTSPQNIKAELLADAQAYMRQFGFEITDFMFVNNIQYPDGNTIMQARQAITSLDSEIRNLEQRMINASNQIEIDVAQAKIDGRHKVADARREASRIRAESSALANAIEQSIKDIGPEATLRLKSAEVFRSLTTNGVIPRVIVTEKSLFASPFYGQSIGTEVTNVAAVQFNKGAPEIVARAQPGN